MNDVVKMARLDLRVILPYRRQALILLAIAPVLALQTHDPRSVLPASVVYGSMLVSSPFAAADKYDLATLYGALPVARSRVVAGRYAFAFVYFLAAAAVGLVLTLAVGAVLGVTVTVPELGLLVAVSLALFALVVALQFPLYFWLGYNKARLLAMLPFVVLFVVVAALLPSLKTATVPPAGSAATACVVVAAALAAASFAISRRLHARRVE